MLGDDITTKGVPMVPAQECKRHAICDGQTHCIYIIDGVDCSSEGILARQDFDPIPFVLSNLGDLAMAVSDAIPTLPIKDAARIAAHLDSLGYTKAPF